ncbi:MAG: SusC/RagA family TonB-linked outer membrane protein [Gemmatimonadales bacterium]
MRPGFRLILTAILLCLMRLGSLSAQQGMTLTGRVTSADGEALVQASVIIERLGVGTTTRSDGRYQLTLPAARLTGDTVTVVARLIGYKPQTTRLVLVAGTEERSFALAANPLQLGEIVVTGVGTVTEVEKLGHVRSYVDSSAIVGSGEQNLINALAAKAPGVTVTSSSGDPGASAYIQVRGLTTISAADGQPLMVVDGVPMDNSISYNNPISGGPNSSASPSNRAIDLNPDDIESVEILKGAASSAIYGSRAGQGVILINTKRGRPGPTRYSLRSSFSVDQAGRLPEFQRKYGLGSGGVAPACVSGAALNCRVGFAQAGSWGPALAAGTPTFDHSDEMFQDGHQTDNYLTVSGGSDRTTFFLSGGYNRQRGIVVGPNSEYRRIAVRFNGSHRITDELKVDANIGYTDGHGGTVTTRNSTDGLLLGAWRTPPDFNNRPYLDPVTGLHRSFRFPNPGPGSEQASRSYDNPFFVANESFGNSDVSRVVGGITTDYAATGWLTFRHTIGYDYSNDERTQAYPWSTSNTTITGINGVGGVNAGYIKVSQIDHTLTATARYHVSPVWSGGLTVGQNLNSQSYRTRQVIGAGLITPSPFNLANTAAQLPPYDFRSTVRLESYFAQATTDLWNQLFLTAALRNDGASTFGPDNRRNWYPKVSAAWAFHRGEAGEQRGLTYGKLRAAYGQSGTQPAPYLLASTLVAQTSADGGWGPSSGGPGGLITTFNLPTLNLAPERVKEFEAGFDLGLLRDRADLSFTHYRAFSSDVILNVPVAGSSGYTSKPANVAALKNIGYELALNLRPISKRDVGWDVGLQWARNRSEVTNLAGVQFAPLPIGGGTNGLGIQGVAIQGQPLGVFYGGDFVRCGRGLNLNGIDLDNTAGECQGATRNALYIDGTGYPQLDASASYVIGNPNPDWTGSVRTGFRWKNLRVGGLLDIRQGGQASNSTRGALNHFGTSKESQRYRDGGTYTFGDNYFGSQHVSGPGAGTAVPLDEAWFTGAGGIFNGPVSQFMEDASFVKLREISLGLVLDQAWVSNLLGFSSMEFRVAGRNLHTWTKYTGVDPETSVLGSATPVQGVEYFNNPQTRSFIFSVTLNR